MRSLVLGRRFVGVATNHLASDMERFWWRALLLLLYLATTKARKGIDVSRLMFTFDLKCFKEKGYEFVVVRAYRTIGCFPDPDGSDAMLKAKEVGFKHIDIYMSPCPRYKSATDQVDEMMKALPNVTIEQIWLNVEYPGNWLGNYTSNQKIFEEIISAANRRKPTGVLTSESEWEGVMGNKYTGGSSYPLWYMQYDNNPTFDDFKSFGGWSKPTMKQYTQDSLDCVANLNLDYSTA